MKISGRVVTVTGGAAGLGAAVLKEAAARGAATVAAIDLDVEGAAEVAAGLDGVAAHADVSDEASLRAAIDEIERQTGPIDVFVSNAGVGGPTGVFTPDAEWDRQYAVHVLSNVYAARILLPRMLARGTGHLASTASANALTSSPLSAVYATTKHAQLALAEWVSMTYGRRGIGVTCFCPKGMVTDMLVRGAERSAYARDSLATAVTGERAAQMFLDAIENDRFLVTTHDHVLEEFARKSSDYEGYLQHMRDLQERLVPEAGAEL